MKKYIIITLYIICGNLSIFPQLNTGRPLGNVMPQTFNFMRYGDVATSLATGAFNLDIPIYTYVDKDFKIPISLSYTTSGFTPTKRSGIVGYDWTLNIGGAISRDVYGKPDDLYNEYGPQKYNETDINGFWWASAEKKYTKGELWDFEKATITNMSKNAAALVLPLLDGGRGYDGEQDIFYFNFLGHSGKFAIGNDRKIICSNNGYKVIPNFAKQHPAQPKPETSSITIISPDGYRYIFGRDKDYYLSAIEYSKANLSLQLQDDPNYNSTTLAWHLTEIIAPNGRKILFTYKAEVLGSDSNSPMFYGTKTGLIDVTSYNDYWKMLTINKIVVLESVEIPDTNTKITFSYSQETKEEGASRFYPTGSEYNAFSYKLDKISVNKNSLLIHKTNLSYIYHKRWRFLSKVINQKEEIYNLQYNLKETPINAIPERLSYVGGGADDPIEINGYLNKNSERGLLNKITYPTGGWTEFTYQSHSYSEKLDFNMTRFRNDPNIKKGYILKGIDASELPPILYNGITGGQRIRKITSYANTGALKKEREFLYLKNYNPMYNNQISSGVLYNERPYWMLGGNKVISGSGILWSQFSSLNKLHIAYSEVTEVESSGNYKFYTKHIFTDYSDARFKVNGSAKFKYQDPDNNFYISSMTSGDFFLIMYTNLFNLTEKVGYLKEKRYLNSDFQSIRIEEFKYRDVVDVDFIHPDSDSNNHMEEKRIVSHRGYVGGAFVRDFYIRSYPKYIERVVLDGVEEKTKYEYNKYDQLSKLIKDNSQTKDSLIYSYTYASERYNDIMTYILMRNNNFLSAVDERKLIKNGKVINNDKYNYTFSMPADESYFCPLVYSYENSKGANSPWKTIIRYDEYDEKGNLLQYTEQDDTPVSHIWSYNNQYLVAEIKNVAYKKVTEALGGQNIVARMSNSSTLFAQDLEKINNLRTALPDALITTYTYKPLVGMLTMTDPSGRTTYYEYDIYNRLRDLYYLDNKDNSTQIIESYDYHYANGDPSTSTQYPPIQLNLELDANMTLQTPIKMYVPISISGGSGDFTFSWYLKDYNSGRTIKDQKSTSPTSFLIELKDFKSDSYILSCTVEDNKSKKTRTISKSFKVSPPPLNLEIEGSENFRYVVNTSQAFKALAKNGSGSYLYSWELKDLNGKVLNRESGSNSVFKVTLPKEGELLVLCTVTDQKTKEKITTEFLFEVEGPWDLEFYNVKMKHEKDHYSLTARMGNVFFDDIVTIQIIFEGGGYGSGTGGSGTFIIGGKHYEFSSNQNISIIVNMPVGGIDISMDLYKGYQQSTDVTGIIKILKVEKGNHVIGSNKEISLSF